jgi:hypothetical protein
LDVKAVTKIVNELNDANHPLVVVIKETVKNRKLIVDTIQEYSDNNYYNTGDDPKNSPLAKLLACDFEKMITECKKNGNNKCCEDIKKYIKDNVDVNHQNKLEMACNTDGLSGLDYIISPICKSPSHLMAVVFYELTGKLIFANNELNYELQEKVFLFIGWLNIVIEKGFHFSDQKLTNLQNSAQKVLL